MRTSTSMRWLVVAVSAAMLLAVAAACSSETIEVPGETVVVKEEVIKTVEVPGETVVKEVVKEVMVPGETVVVEKVVTETVEVPGQTVVIEKIVTETIEVPGETVTVEVVKEVQVPGETVVVEKVVTQTVQVPGETVVVEKEVVKTVEVPGETVVVEKEVVKTVEVPGETVVVEKVVVKEVPAGYVTDPTNGKVHTAPSYGGTITTSWRKFPPGVDTYDTFSVYAHISGNIEKLAIMDWGIDRDEFDFRTYNMPNFVMKGHLAESWDISPDGLTFTFNIRQGVNWHDKAPMNGRELTADDIEWNFHRQLGLGSGFTEVPPTADRFATHEWESVTATDKWTVVFKLTEPRLWALNDLFYSENALWMYPPEVFEQDGELNWRNLVGTGPYMLTESVEGSSFTLTKNPDYWGYDEKYPNNRLPYTDELRGLHMPDVATRMAALRTGKIDFPGTIRSIDTADSLRRTNPEIGQYAYRDATANAIAINVTKPPLDDIRVRQALQMAINHEEINDIFFKGLADWKPKGPGDLQGMTVPFDEWPEEVKKYYTYDPEGAEALLDAAGLPRVGGADGMRFKSWVPSGGWPGEENLAYVEAVVAYFREIGVELEMRPIPSAEFMSVMEGREYGFMTTRAGSGLCGGGCADWEVSRYAVQKDGPFYPQYWEWNKAATNDPDYNRMILEFRAATSMEEYGRLLGEADMYVVNKHWLIWGVATPFVLAAQPWVKGWNGEVQLGRHNKGPLYARLWIDQEEKAARGR